jgi:hypothetical protein
MSTMEQEIERVLRAAPRPMPPTGLKDQLIGQARLPVVPTGSQILPATLAPAAWLRRWWPLLAPAAVSLACAVGLTVQQTEIRDLKRTIQDLSRDSAVKPGTRSKPTMQTNAAAPDPDAAARTQQEIGRLKALASQLAAEVQQLEQLRAENATLRSQLETPTAGFFTPDETEALTKAKEKTDAINCMNNLKQLGLAVRVWAMDNGDISPPNLLEMTNEMATPKILVCPTDSARQPAKDWASYTPANCSYDYLAPSAPETEPTRVLFRCPIHGHIGLSDGSVQGYVAKQHPERLVQHNGKLYLPEPPPPAQRSPVPQPDNPPPGNPNP